MSMVQQAVEVSAPLHTVYEQLATLENYPRFMQGVERVTPLGNDQTHWVMELQGQRREFDATITERSLDKRVSWSTIDGPLVAETLTVRPIGETRTQIVAQLEADAAFLLPGDRHAPETLNRRLKSDLNTFKSLCETGKLSPRRDSGASSKQLSGRAATVFTGGPQYDAASPSSVAARSARPTRPGAGGKPGSDAGSEPDVDIASAPGITNAHDLDDILAPGRRVGGPGSTSAGSAEMGGRAMSAKDARGDGMIHEEDRGSAHDF